MLKVVLLIPPLLLFSCDKNSHQNNYISSYFEAKKKCETNKVSYDIYEHEIDIIDVNLSKGGRFEWKAQRVFLGDTCIQAAVGPLVSLNDKHIIEYYVIDVEMPQFSNSDNEKDDISWLTIFQREFKISELTSDIQEQHIDSIVSFDEVRNTVVFSLGEDKFVYSLPQDLKVINSDK